MASSKPASVAIIVGNYLREQYPAALSVYLQEAGLEEQELENPTIPDLRTIIHDHYTSLLTSSLSSTFLTPNPALTPSQSAAHAISPSELMKRKVSDPVPLREVERRISGVATGNLLAVWVGKVPRRWFDTSTASYTSSYPLSILLTSVDRTLRIIDFHTGEVEALLEPHKAAILSFAVHPREGRYVVSGSMDGSAILTDLISAQPIQRFPHSKFVVRVAFSSDGRYLATASYDRTIVVYEAEEPDVSMRSEEDEDRDMSLDEGDDPALAKEPDLRYRKVHTIDGLNGNPESLVFHPSSSHLLYTTRSSHLLHYLSLTNFNHSTKSFNPNRLDTHVSFSVLNMVIHPEGGLIACQTGDHAGHSGERILIYDVKPPTEVGDGEKTGVEQGDERLQTIWTGSMGDDYVLPRMAWLPDGSGLVTTTTTGQLTLLDLSGKVRSRIKIHGGTVNGAPASEIVRDVTAVKITNEDGIEETKVVSIGYDGQICISR